MSFQPLVSIICLCYNHEHFIKEALDSVIGQSYPAIEVIVVDDMSTDGSVKIIKEYLQEHPQIKFISTGKNSGNCAAFNMGWQVSTGTFIIDFATDDVLLPQRVTQQVEAFKKLDSDFGVIYTDAEYITDTGEHLYYHSQKYNPAPAGDVFAALLERYFISSATMMMRRSVLDELKGYDENLYYEDFDFWIRSARMFKYAYLNCVTTKRRVHKASMSQQWYTLNDPHLKSHIVILKKAQRLVLTEAERVALEKRLEYEARQFYLSGNFTLGEEIFKLMHEVYKLPLTYQVLEKMNQWKINLRPLRSIYYKLLHNKL